MDMLETLRYTVKEGDCGPRGFMGICPLVHWSLIAATARNTMEGGSRRALIRQLKAVWMIRRIKLRQFLHAGPGDELTGYGSSRTLCGNQYAQHGELHLRDRLVASMDLIIMPVELESRHRLTCEDTEPLFSRPALNEAPSFEPLPMISDMDYPVEHSFTQSDCDSNASHLPFFSYPALVLEMAPGSAGEDTSLVSLMQLDYIRECLAGSRIHLGSQPQGRGYAVQARHENGKPCFNAYVEYGRI